MRRHVVPVSALVLASSAGLAHGQAFTESFNDITTLPGSGWFLANHSTNAATAGIPAAWFQGNPSVFPGNSGVGYLAVNFNATPGTGTISAWALTPTATLSNGDTLLFFTRTVTGQPFPDRLQIRMSTNGSSTNIGTTETDVGDFTTLLADINPTYSMQPYPVGYPDTWTGITLTVAGLGAPTSGRFAFRYFVENGGPTGANSDYIGIDDVVYTPVGTPVGACCRADGTCTGSVSTAACTVLGGVHQGTGTACGSVVCPQPGACCLTNGLCTFTAQFSCTAQGGAFRGAGVGCVSVTCPGAFNETGDAGDLPATAAVTSGVGSLLCINGTLTSATDVDMFKISVCNSSSFSATTTGTGTNVDTELWLFDANGVGVTANDDDPAGGVSTSALSSANVTANGTYFLAVSAFDVRPNSAAGSIWDPPLNSTIEFTPDGPGAAQPVANWTGTGSGTGSYAILMTGSCFAVTPACYANCDHSTTVPFLNVADFTCFLQRFAAADPYANCDNSTQAPVLNVADFTCFLQKFAAGCSAP
jgi:hypothetical protein